MATIQRNLGHLIESYAVNEYEKLIANEMTRKDYLAIVVKDFNMGKVLGTGAYVTGSVRDDDGQVKEYDNQQAKHRDLLHHCFLREASEIISDEGIKVGLITICITDRFVNAQRNQLMMKDFIMAVLTALLLIGLLFGAIRRFLLAPISNIVDGVGQAGPDGIPLAMMPVKGAREIVRLSEGVNHMIETIRQSREDLEATNQALADEKERFELAVDGTSDGLWDWNLLTDEVIHSPRFETMLGYAVGELPNTITSWTDLLHPNDAQRAKDAVQDYLSSRGHRVYESTFRMRSKSGEWRWITGRGKAIFAGDGTPIRFVGFNSDVTDKIKHQEQLDHTAKHDSLTVLPNRFLFNELIQKAIAQSVRSKRWLALLYIDLNGFKAINDTYGHAAGDKVLVQTAQRINRIIRKEDISARLGGDEFVIAITNLSTKKDVIPFLDRLLHDLKEGFYYKNDKVHELDVSASIGVTFYPQEVDLGSDSLLRQADQAMYEAKSSGKNRYHFFNVDEDKAIKEHMQQVSAFEKALDNNELILHFQPRVDMVLWSSKSGHIFRAI